MNNAFLLGETSPLPVTINAFPEEQFLKNIHAHLLLKDYDSALIEGLEALKHHPRSPQLLAALIEIHAAKHNEKEMMALWKTYRSLSGSLPTLVTETQWSNLTYSIEERRLLEKMAWSIITKASGQSALTIRLMALLGAFVANDRQGVAIIRKQLHEPNFLFRAAAIEIASRLRDPILCKDVYTILKQEKKMLPRLQAIKAMGSMQYYEAKPDLIAILNNSMSSAEEKAASINSLVEISEAMQENEVIALSKSSNSALRKLACEIISSGHFKEHVNQITPLINDSNAEVRIGALHCIGLIDRTCLNKKNSSLAISILKAINDPHPEVAITAAWILLINGESQAEALFSKWLNHSNIKVQRFAAGALKASGQYGIPLTLKFFQTHSDSFVRLNLAIGLIQQRSSTVQEFKITQACDVIYSMLLNSKENWMNNADSPFPYIVKSDLKHNSIVSQYPKMEDQLVRLELLNLLAILKYPKAQLAVREFLQEKSWGITATSAAVMLTEGEKEGDEEVLEIIEGLFNDPNKQVRIQAALVLAVWGRDERAIQVLQTEYGESPREMKEKILESLGSIGALSSLPFLIQALEDSAQTLRIIAACAILQTLNH